MTIGALKSTVETLASSQPRPPPLQKKKKKTPPLSGASGLTVDPHPQATVLPRDAGPSGRASTAASDGEDESGGGGGGGTAAVAFVSLSCSGCGAALGKRFGERGLPPRLARLAGLFCLEVDSISSYELGKPELVAAVSTAGKREAAMDAAAAAAATAAATTTATATTTPSSKDSLALSSLLSRVAELEEELLKVQNVVLGHNEALANLQE